ncbi:2-oxo acid dehydrogenase subunit E2 [Acinetobacter sp. C_4_1]|uniref:2-oxo acid dehydrogenase subunit E2 n=1 Tax=unclassified Acinetobacter TaxID=196816 RepID=UPI0021B7434A|nr:MULTISPECIES: 2-oxo acid dehydrogenase subunit E2 [unclassified Acinetobacter]MCT8088256.1 2-oxo acid dehydrogenase subunit E2 [Acinetobacter sp. F_3_1]MCT8097625.1 2-oxo acid dehydrogenase subunit E2 [Acinetobacter sp. C_3_1]MCT8100718.1 2-oxo acid dehydrogenase subunit E2 [Acinetobacter sp. C_4_1]MCT8133995.1 2-oxo acid dehydrogenase subunit E2 [Acinetobacter sp. T_3_1]
MSEIKTLEIPKWGLSMEEGTIAQWLIQEGTQFSKGQEICEIETTKIVNVLEAPFDGLLRKIIAKDGDTLVVGGIIAICADAQVSDAEVEAFAQSLGGTPAVTENKAVAAVPEKVDVAQVETKVQAAPKQNSVGNGSKAVTHQGGYSIPAALQGYQQSDDIFATPHALKLAEKHNVNLAQITGSGREGRISVQDIQAAVQAAGGSWPDVRHQASTKAAKSKADDSDVLATPVARRLAKQWGINLHDCRASGSRGRVCKEDVEAVYQRENPVQAQHTEYTHPTESAKFTTVAMNGMRKAIAARLQAAKRNAPHFRLTIDLNVESVQALRQQINSTVPQVKLSINDMLIKAAAAALIKVPQVNVQFDEENQQILQFEQADISVAVAIENGLITPIIKAANRKSLAQISNDMRDLATRAKTGKLAPNEFQGGSFSISNLGMLGIPQFDAIINPPQGAILALGAAEKRAVVENDEIVVREMVTATLSCDHRVIDGALGAQFLSALKQFVENPALILV